MFCRRLRSLSYLINNNKNFSSVLLLNRTVIAKERRISISTIGIDLAKPNLKLNNNEV